MLRFHPYFDIRHNQDGRVVGCRRRPHYASKKIPWYSFLLEAERTPGLLNADRKRRSRENFQGPYRESNPDPPVLCAVNLTLRRLMSYIYIYGAPILDVSRSHTTTQHSR